MASKQLTANVRLNTKQAEQKLKNIAKAIDAINRATGKQTNAYSQVNAALNKTERLETKVKQETDKTVKSTRQWVSALNAATGKLANCKSLVGSLASKMGGLLGTITGGLTVGVAIQGADTLTGAQNRFNNIAAMQLGDSAYTRDANGNVTGYSDKALNFTSETMDKIYASAQKVRTEYSDMLSNVSKTMTLAPEAFQGNIDNAIRFQEIMSEAYAVGGASAQEMSTSMYQLTQALGAGVLAGDELRSVREGAPLAYQKIEEFAQGVLGTTESLKDLASQGQITSDMVVAAVMSMGDEMDTAFSLTKYRFTDVWNQIKSAAQKSFSPVVEMMTNKLNELVENGFIQKVEQFFTNVAKFVMIAFRVIENVIQWIANNWSWLKDVIIIGLIMMATLETAILVSKIALWVKANLAMLKTVLIIALIVAAIYFLWQTWSDFANGAITLGEAIIKTLLIIGVVGALVALILGAWLPALIILGIALVLAALVYFFSYICYGVAFIVAVIINVLSFIWNLIIWIVQAIVAVVVWVVADIVGLALGLVGAIGAICENIGIAFQNAWIWAKNTFWEFIADVIDGVSRLEPVINGIASLLDMDGVDFGKLSSGIRSKKSEYKEFVSVGDAWSKGYNSTSDWVSNSVNWVGQAHTGYVNPLSWGESAMNWGSDLMNYQNEKTNSGSEKTSWLDKMGDSLGLNDQFDKLAGTGDGNTINPDSVEDLLKNANGINDNTDKMADSMELTEEDLKYLRSIAEMEWKKEYTSNNIKIDMTNNNTVNGDSDLDGIVTKLSDKLREELNVVADGVYAY